VYCFGSFLYSLIDIVCDALEMLAQMKAYIEVSSFNNKHNHVATYIFGFNLLIQYYSTIVTRLVYLSQCAPKLRKQKFHMSSEVQIFQRRIDIRYVSYTDIYLIRYVTHQESIWGQILSYTSDISLNLLNVPSISS
jgi:hypothetical protein